MFNLLSAPINFDDPIIFCIMKAGLPVRRPHLSRWIGFGTLIIFDFKNLSNRNSQSIPMLGRSGVSLCDLRINRDVPSKRPPSKDAVISQVYIDAPPFNWAIDLISVFIAFVFSVSQLAKVSAFSSGNLYAPRPKI